MVRDVRQLDSPFSENQVKHILRNFDPDGQDACQDNPKSIEYNVEGLIFPYTRTRPITVAQVMRAMKYIGVCVKKYPFNLRMELASDLWDTYCEVWQDTGDERRAMRAI